MRMTIREHPLAWRWTDPDHTVLPDEILSRMAPVDQCEAKRLSQRTRDLLAGSCLSPRVFPTLNRQSTDCTFEAGTAWLRQQQPDLSAPVVVSWRENLAIRTTWEIFTAHWDDFCYPSSDDVLVFPDSECWALLYFHEEEFQFGYRRKG